MKYLYIFLIGFSLVELRLSAFTYAAEVGEVGESTVATLPSLSTQPSVNSVSDIIPIDEYHEVSAGIFRGARPNKAGLKALAEAGIKFDLNIDNDSSQIEQEQKDASELGIQMISMPMSGFWAPEDQLVDKVLEILANVEKRPIFIHCQFGQDRTGLIVGLHRVRNEHWTPKDAYEEMLRYNFHRALFLLDRYFKLKTGFSE